MYFLHSDTMDQIQVLMILPWRERLGRRLRVFAADTAFMIRV